MLPKLHDVINERSLTRCGAHVAGLLGAFDQLRLEKLALIRTARHVAEVLAEVVHASRTTTQKSSGQLEVAP